MADNNREITTVFRADISQFTQSTQQLNKYVATVNAEFKNATASMGKWNDNADGLTAKLKQLNGVLDAEQKRLNAIQAEYDDVVRSQGANSKAAQELYIKLNQQQAKVKDVQKQIEHYSNSLDELTEAGVETRQELDALNKKIEEQKQAAKDLGGKVLKGAAVGMAGFAAACVGALGTLGKIVEETKELRTQMGQLETTFTQQGHSVDTAKKTYDDLYSVIGDSGKVTEASMHLGQLAKNEQELNDYTNILTGVYATFGDSLPIEGLAEAMNHTASLGSVQGNLADALEWAGVNVDDFNAQLETLNTEEERAQLINKTLQGIYGETASKYKEVNKDVIAANDAQNQYNQAMADIGAKAQPAITSFKTAMVEVLQKIFDKFKEVDIEGLIGKITGALTSLIDNVLPPLMEGLDWVLDNLNWLAPLLGGLVGTIAAVTGGIKAYQAIVNLAKAAQVAWNFALNANPIGLVITAIGLLVAAFATLWKKSESFRNFWKGLWDVIKNTVSTAVDKIKGVLEAVVGFFKGMINGLISGVNFLIKGLNKISFDVPDWVPNIGGKKLGFNIPTIPKLAKGGIVTKPTLAMVGEAGKEAVMPLENNTAWIDKLADKLGDRMGGNTVNNFNYTFEKMQTTKLALHKAQLETKRLIGG